MDSVTKNLLKTISSLHKIPNGAISIRENGKSSMLKSSKNIIIQPKGNGEGIDVFVKRECQGEACHVPAIVSENNIVDVAYNDFYIESGAKVVIVAGCGIHSNGESSHTGIHSFYVGENAVVEYYENHYGEGSGRGKVIDPTTKIKIENGGKMIIKTTQIGGVDFSDRVTECVLKDAAVLEVEEKVLTARFEVAKTKFKATMLGENSRCNIVSKSVAKGESEQVFKSNLIGKNSCVGRVECDGILLDGATMISQPIVTAKHRNASLNHEATIGRIAGDQLVKLMTLGLTEKQAEEKIIAGFLK